MKIEQASDSVHISVVMLNGCLPGSIRTLHCSGLG